MPRPSLSQYRQKRDFGKTREPRGGRRRQGRRRFVIQKHDASSLHYDFRLEIDGVLVSWAVPKGLSTDPSDKRLAIRTEDHPLDYADFEGVIPKGEHGGGTVMIWDSGTYENLRRRKGRQPRAMSACLDEGLVEINLSGEKLGGAYALKRIRKDEKPQWLVIKKRDDSAARSPKRSIAARSVKTGRTLREIKKAG